MKNAQVDYPGTLILDHSNLIIILIYYNSDPFVHTQWLYVDIDRKSMPEILT